MSDNEAAPEELEGQLPLFEDPHVIEVFRDDNDQPVCEVTRYPTWRDQEGSEWC